MRIANRMQQIQPFHVMALLARARQLEASGRSIIHMEIGEPDFVTPQPVIDRAMKSLAAGQTHYTPATGLPALRERIAGFYRERYQIDIAPSRIIVTPGASTALQLVLAALANPGERVLMSDPGYPCNRNFVHLLNAEPVGIPVGPASGYQPSLQQVQEEWDACTSVLLLASPSNPTGTLLDASMLDDFYGLASRQGGSLVVDEIYHGLTYGSRADTALSVSADIVVVNSFSKYFGMTGWRLGWLVVPESLLEAIDKLAQNLFLAAPTTAQYAALAAFDTENIAILEERREEFRERRDYLLPALRELGFDIPVTPDGAFYLYADCSRFSEDSYQFSNDLLEHAGVAITPGIDFGSHQPGRHVRFAYTTTLDNLQEGISRLDGFLRGV